MRIFDFALWSEMLVLQNEQWDATCQKVIIRSTSLYIPSSTINSAINHVINCSKKVDTCLFHDTAYISTNLTTISTPRNRESGSLPALPHNYWVSV